MFFLKSNRSGLLTFCGTNVNVVYDKDGESSKHSFRLFENGEIKIDNLKSQQPNVLKSVIIGKKSWGLFLKEWSNGITEWCFTKDEILKQFEEKNIKVPGSLLKEFDNLIEKKRIERNLTELKKMKKC